MIGRRSTSIGALDGADLVLVHEWTDPALVSRLAALRRAGARFLFCFSTRTIAWSARPTRWRSLDLDGFDAVLAFGEALAEAYRGRGWGRRAYRLARGRRPSAVFAPCPELRREHDLVWIGNWGDGERAAELREFLIEPGQRIGSLGAGRMACVTRPSAATALAAGRDRICRISAEFRGAASLCGGPDDRPRPTPALCADPSRHSDYPHVRGSRLRDSAGLGAVGRLRGAVHGGRRLPGRTKRRGNAASPRCTDAPIPRCGRVSPRMEERLLSPVTAARIRVEELLAICTVLGRESGRAAMAVAQ